MIAENDEMGNCVMDRRLIDRLVYDLYGLTKEEIKIVENIK